MTLRQIINECIATDDELGKAEDAASRMACSARPSIVVAVACERIGERLVECRTFIRAAEVMKALLSEEELDREAPPSTKDLFQEFEEARRLLQAIPAGKQ